MTLVANLTDEWSLSFYKQFVNMMLLSCQDDASIVQVKLPGAAYQ